MVTHSLALTVLNDALACRSHDVYIGPGIEEAQHLASLEADLRSHLCEPFPVRAKVKPPAFPFAAVDEEIEGFCIAHRSGGYWLVYQPEAARFLAFWGTESTTLGAHGVYGSPLYCWSA